MADDEPLLDAPRTYNRTGRPPYPVEAMYRAALTKHLLGLRYYRELAEMLRSNRTVRELCGFTDCVPNTSSICRFFGRLTNHLDLVDQAVHRLADRIAEAVESRWE